MLKSTFLVLVALAIAVGGGAASVAYALKDQAGIGAVTVGGWTAFPDLGTPGSDPYSKARVAREGVLALGQAEGLPFVAARDSAGEPLRRDCAYKIEGSLPPARLWTLYAGDAMQGAIANANRRPAALHSLSVLRQADNSVVVSVGPRPAPGNWLEVSGAGAMTLVLTLYDTPIASSTGLADIALPQILKAGCDA